MSEVQAISANFESAQKQRRLKIETSLYDSQGSDLPTPPSQIWYQYSEQNIKTPTQVKFPPKNTSQYVQFSNNLYRQAGASEFTESPEHQYAQKNSKGDETGLVEQKQKKVRKQKLKFVSELSLPENQKNEILTRNQEASKQKSVENIFGYGVRQSSVNSKSSYEARDVDTSKRRFVLDQTKKQQKSGKEGELCSACTLM